MIVTRFSPSNTGSLHIGGARTALYNWLYAKHTGGKFLLRIEDTDAERSDETLIQPIIDGLAWLGIDHDGDVVFQSDNADRHREVAAQFLVSGHAYKCFVSSEELAEQRAAYAKIKKPFLFQSPWRDSDGSNHPVDMPYVVRFKMPREGETTINDMVQGRVSVQNSTLDDLIILRADGSPTYMLAVVVDDCDMGVNVVCRGDDHLTNTFKQIHIAHAIGQPDFCYAHIPLIHNEEGKKLSKRNNDAGIDFYKNAGFPAEAVFNYLLRMGWGHGDHEIFTREQAIKLFNFDGVGRAPARLDIKRLEHLSGVYIQNAPLDVIQGMVAHLKGGKNNALVDALIPLVQVRSKTVIELCSYIEMVLDRPTVDETPLSDMEKNVFVTIRQLRKCDAETIEATVKYLCENMDYKIRKVMEILRLAITGSKISPPMYQVMELLGRDECIHRIPDFEFIVE